MTLLKGLASYKISGFQYNEVLPVNGMASCKYLASAKRNGFKKRNGLQIKNEWLPIMNDTREMNCFL